MYPKSGDPSVTLVEEKMLYPEPCTDHGFMDWGMMCHVVDENGKDYVRSFVDHLQSIGYNWPGRLEGTLTVGGETHQVHGFCSRERTILPDQSNVEAGGWLDLIMVNFDELHTACTEYKLSRDKACELYLRKEDKYYATKDPKAPVDEMLNFEITHEDWAFIKAIGCFVPTTYIVKVEVEEGTLEYTAKVCGCKCVAQQAGAEADVPNVTLDAKEVTGTFTYKDGTVLELHNGFFINNVVCWRAYPSWIPNFGAAQDYVEVNPMKG